VTCLQLQHSSTLPAGRSIGLLTMGVKEPTHLPLGISSSCRAEAEHSRSMHKFVVLTLASAGHKASRRSGVALQWAVCRVKTGDETRDGCAALPQAQTATVQLKGSLARLLHQAVAQCTKSPNSHGEKSPLLRPGLEPQCTPDPCRQHQHSMSR
jgi:hypothetical protein